jgi:hypothetical protein
MNGSHRHRQRHAFALVTCVLWLLGVEVLPNLHLALHHDDHTHAADGTLVAFHDHDHDHDDGDHDHALDAGDHDDDGQPALDHLPRARHQAGGVSHHAVALHRPPPPLLAPIPVARAVWRLEATLDDAPRSAALARPTSRGPPSI